MRIGYVESGKSEFDGELFPLVSYDGKSIGEVFLADPLVLEWNLRNRQFNNLLRELSLDDIKDIFEKAGTLFLDGNIQMGDQVFSAKDYAEHFSKLTGAPISAPLRTIRRVSSYFKNIIQIIQYQLPHASLSVLDKGYYIFNGKKFGWIPKGNNLFVTTPSNHPSVNLLWILSIAFGYNVVIRPSINDPFTPLRLMQALVDAGLPKQAFNFYPSRHRTVQTMQKICDRSILFGGEEIVKQYSNTESTRVFGPGRSIMVVGKNYNNKIQTVIDLAVESMIRDGGRGCINLSCIISMGNGREIADEIAKRVASIEIYDPLDGRAIIGAIKHKKLAESINAQIEQLMSDTDEDITKKYRHNERLLIKDNSSFLQATVIYCEDNKGIFGNEYGFPFLSIIDAKSNAEVIYLAKNSLTVSLLSDDQSLFNDLLFSPNIGKVYQGEHHTCDIDFCEPHDGYLSDFLFSNKAVRAQF